MSQPYSSTTQSPMAAMTASMVRTSLGCYRVVGVFIEQCISTAHALSSPPDASRFPEPS